MPDQRPNKVIVDTNLWISFLIGKELQYLKDLIINERIKLITSDQLLNELVLVTSREKLKKYFNQEDVKDLILLIDLIAKKIKIKKVEQICRDPKDDFLLALSKKSQADFLVTGDKDLLEIKTYRKTQILTAQRFRKLIIGR